jgi:hypothetical protein
MEEQSLHHTSKIYGVYCQQSVVGGRRIFAKEMIRAAHAKEKQL